MSAFTFLRSATAYSSGAPHVLSVLAIVLECLRDQENAAIAHSTAARLAASISFPTPILNAALFLLRQDAKQHRDAIIDLLSDFEKCWVARDGDFDLRTMRLATGIASAMDVVQHMAWIRVRPSTQAVVEPQPETSAAGAVVPGTSILGSSGAGTATAFVGSSNSSEDQEEDEEDEELEPLG